MQQPIENSKKILIGIIVNRKGKVQIVGLRVRFKSMLVGFRHFAPNRFKRTAEYTVMIPFKYTFVANVAMIRARR